MSDGMPTLSVIVPTVGRGASLARLIGSLEREAPSAPPFEVVVVEDGSADAGVASLLAQPRPFGCRLLRQAASGAAQARNAGAHAAEGTVLLFLDDDVELLPGALQAHAALHERGARYIGLGDLPPAIVEQTFFGIILRRWWVDMRDGIQRPGYRYGFRDLFTGHCSMRRDTFDMLGGFDPAFRCHEDWELGYRAIKAGFDLRFLPAAVAVHHDTSDLAKVLRRKFDEGVADVQLCHKHPQLVGVLPLSSTTFGRRQRLVRALAWQRADTALALPRALAALLPVFEQLRLRGRWRRALNGLLSFWYWRGVASVLTREELEALRAAAGRGWQASPATPIDLHAGVEPAALQMDDLRPESVVLVFGHDVIGVVPPNPGAERLRGEHLPLLLARWFPRQYQAALARAGEMPPFLARYVASSVSRPSAIDDQRSVAARGVASGAASLTTRHW